MNLRMTRIGILGAVAGCSALLLTASVSNAAPRYISGVGGVLNPSVSAGNYERGPIKVSALGVADGTATNVTTVANPFTIPINALNIDGQQLRAFPTFAFVAQNSFSYMTTQPFSERLEPGGGAAAAGAINFCPPQGDPDPLNGNLACTAFNNPGVGNYNARIGIDQRRTTTTMGAPGAPIGVAFGGTLRLARNIINSNVWFGKPPFLALGNTTGMQRVSKQPNSAVDLWTPGQENFGFNTNVNDKGPQYSAMLTSQGKILSLTAGPFAPTGSNDPVDRGVGFKMTTGVVSGSDIYPPIGASTPFYFFQSTGDDTVTPGGEIRNIVLIGGGFALSGASGSLFNRVQVLDIAMVVPEPAQAGGLAAGLVGIIALAWMRRRA